MVSLLCGLLLLCAGPAQAQIALPYTESFTSIPADDAFPIVNGGSWARSGTAALQPTWIGNESFNRIGRGTNDSTYLTFAKSQPAGGNVYTVGPFQLTAGMTYETSIWYITDGTNGFGPLQLTYGTAGTLAAQTNVIATVPPNVNNQTYQRLRGFFNAPATGLYYIGIKAEASANPQFLTLDDFSIAELPACSASPSPGATLASAASVCPTTSLRLRLANNPLLNSGITFQWQSSTNGSTYTNVAANGRDSVYVTTQSVATWYRAQVTCGSGSSALTSISTPVQVTMNGIATCYCVPAATVVSPVAYFINNFSTSGATTNIANAGSGAGTTSAGYSNFVAQTASAYQGNPVNFNVSFGTAATSAFGFGIYVDWNQDGDFGGPGENVYSSTASATSFTGSFNVPGTALPGNTRMRIRAEFGSATGPGACNTIAGSEAEDYTLNVLALLPCTGTPTPGRVTTFSNVPVTGFTTDVIANGPGALATTTTGDFDGSGYFLLDSTFQATTGSALPQYALPVSGSFNSATTPGLNFRLAPATGNNSLRLTGTGTGKLTFTNQVAANTLYLLAASGGGASTVSVKVTYANASTETINGIVINDWTGTGAAAITGIGRVSAPNVQDGTATNPRLYQVAVPISLANQTLAIDNIEITRSAGAGVANILGVSAETPSPRPVCEGTPGRVLTMGYITSSTGVNYQWMEGTSPGGPYVPVTGGTGATTLTYVTPVAAATKYYVLRLTCANSTLFAFSNEVAVTVLPNPTVTVASNPAASNVCGTNTVTLTATGSGPNYLWYPATGLSSRTVAAPVANPTSAQFYYVLNTAANGCTAIASKAVGVFSSPTLTARVSTATICAGGTTTLTAVDSNFGVGAQIATYTNGTVTTPATDEDLGNVTFGTLNNTSTCASLTGTIGTATGTAGGYSDFTAVAPQRYFVGSTYPLSISVLDCNTANKANAVAVYIDYNMNGLFTDPGEQVYASTATTTGAHTETSNITIPYTARLGVTRMRVISNQGLVTGPQMSPANGEIEDYTVRIVRASVITPANLKWTPTANINPTSGNTVLASGLTATTTFTVTGTDSNNCISTATVTVNVNPLPTLTVTPAATGTPAANNVCIGSTLNLTASGAVSYTWSPNTAISTTTGATVTVSPTSNLTYTVTGTDANGCVNTLARPVRVNPLPTITVNPATAALCFGGKVTLTASGAGTTGTYAWTPSATLSAATGASVDANPTLPTTYTVTGTDANGCVGTATKSVSINPLPTVAIAPSAISTICVGQNVAMTASGASTYAWTPTATLSAATGASVTATPTATTAYTVTGTDANGCQSSATKTIYVNALPTVAISPATTQTVCGTGSVALTASGASTYTWTPSTFLSGTTGATVTSTPTATTTYTVTGTDANGCENTATRTINYFTRPVVTITPGATVAICRGQSATLTAAGAVTYLWTPNATLDKDNVDQVIATPTATTTYSVTGTDANGCTSTAVTRQVTVRALPTIAVGPTTVAAFCSGGSAKLYATGGATYTWAPAASVTTTTTSRDTAIVTPTATTTYTVTGTDANGCVNTATKVITVNPLPTITVTPTNAAVCIGSSLPLSASGAATYAWTPTATLSSGTGTTVNASPTVNTTYTVTGTDANGCVNSTTKAVTVNALPVITVAPATVSVVCSGSPITLTASGAATYSWTPVATLNTPTGATVIASPVNTTGLPNTTTYTVTGTDVNGCVNTATKTINVNPLPTVTVAPATAVGVCAGSTATLTASGAISYTWTPATGLNVTSGATVVAGPATTTTYTVSGTDGNGCVNTATKMVTVNPIPVITIGSSVASGQICNGTNTVLTAGGAATYTWTPSGSLSSPTGTSVVASPSTTTTYTVTGTTAAGCVSTASRTITVLPSPDASITPTGTITICQGDTVTLSGVTGNTAYSWRIYGTPIAAATGMTYRTFTGGFYTLRVTGTNGCTDTTVTPTIINVIERPVPTISRSGNTLLSDSVYAAYQWYFNGVAIPGATAQVYTPTQNGLYTVQGTKAGNNCPGVSAAYNFGPNVGVPGTAGIVVKIYPNPATDEVRIEAPVAVTISVIAMDGKLVYQSDKAEAINVRNWADGVYRVLVRNSEGAVLKMEKITKISH